LAGGSPYPERDDTLQSKKKKRENSEKLKKRERRDRLRKLLGVHGKKRGNQPGISVKKAYPIILRALSGRTGRDRVDKGAAWKADSGQSGWEK